MADTARFVSLGEKFPDADDLGRVCVLGLGKSGTATAALLLEALNNRVPFVEGMVIYAGKRNQRTEAAAAPFVAAGIEVLFDTEEVQGDFDTCVVSPGIPALGGFYRSAESASRTMMSEPELAWRLSPERWIAITGTNGKTTTTSLTTHLLCESGMPALSVGNIGDPCITAARNREKDTYLVAELSSFQLHTTSRFAPQVAVLLNITPDHVEWHGSLEAYARDKAKVFSNMTADSLAIIDVRDEGAARVADELRARGVRLLAIDTQAAEPAEGFATCCGGELCVWVPGGSRVDLGPYDELYIKGEHNSINALAACACALEVGADPARVAAALCTFRPLAHRIEPAGEVNGVAYYNDSKATNTDSTVKALTAFGDKPLIVLLGGHDKLTSLDELVAACAARVKAVVCFGESRERFMAAFDESDCMHVPADHLRDALEVAAGIAEPGDVVALSPACSSFDEFSNFEERGDVFKQYVEAMGRESRR